ncbi:hypothetical protein BN1232_04807 [Mycobacterium lentiflavum]|uniref:Postpolyketide modification protein n=1 Tax=Mycobacterium lentiflavum TaxID=141349 RepID=A0A0E4H3N8_MYCLN|nr:hypothetical protein [Mycobacterium lentiflavum]CQD20150.1 hypothetical protein BN1232_04807 [Mycobacterium lentiflavum]
MPPNILPSPSNFSAGPFAGWFFTLYAGAFLVGIAVIWALFTGFRNRNWLPLLLIAGGFLCSVFEPMLDLLGHLRWANDLPIYAFTNFGIDVPLLIPFCYAAFLGLEPYFIYLLFRRGVTVKQVMFIYLIAGLTDAVMETPGLLLHVYEYYGIQPYTFLSFPYWYAAINGASFMTIGFFIWYLEPRLEGWRRALFLVVPPIGMGTAWFSIGWIHLLPLNSTLPEWIKWVATTVMIGAYFGLIRGIAYFVAVPENEAVDWNFGQLLTYRFLSFLPPVRQRMLNEASQRAA